MYLALLIFIYNMFLKKYPFLLLANHKLSILDCLNYNFNTNKILFKKLIEFKSLKDLRNFSEKKPYEF